MRIYRLDESRQGAFRASYELERAVFGQTTDHAHDDESRQGFDARSS